MANSQVTVRDTQLEKQRLGFINLNLTALTTTAVPDIVSGSAVEVGGSLYSFTANETPTGWAGIANDNQVYIKLTPGTPSVTSSFVTTAPTYSSAKGGWYSGDDRYVARVYKDASGNAKGKAVYPMWSETDAYVPAGLSGGNLPFTTIETITTGSGNWTVPLNVYHIKTIVTGGGGGGSDGNTPSGSDGGDSTFSTITCGGGGGSDSSSRGAPGSSSGGDVNLTGGYPRGQYGGDSYWGQGAPIVRDAISYGAGGGGRISSNRGGAAAGTAISIISVTPGQTISYSIGAGGSGGSFGDGSGAGADGIIYLEY